MLCYLRLVCLFIAAMMQADSDLLAAADRTPASPTDLGVSAFLERFDQIVARGYVPTRRAGSTGVGHTLEVLLGIPENNDPRGDFQGIEIKAWRTSRVQSGQRRPTNLFLKEPRWLDSRSTAERIRRYGYRDSSRRMAWYRSVTARENNSGLKLERDAAGNRLLLMQNAEAVGFWPDEILAQRLEEKLKQVIFVGAEARGSGRQEQFRYHTAIWCRNPSLEALLQIIEEGDGIVELRMHLPLNGSARNHGTAFRIRRDRIRHLYRSQTVLRPR